jgi:flagellar protein FlgJ
MTGPIRSDGPRPAAPLPASEDAKLRKVAHQMEGVFVDQLFKVMRETVPRDGLLDGGAGEEMFQGMMDEHLAAEVPLKWEHGLGEALYRQLRGALGGARPDAASNQAAGGSK